MSIHELHPSKEAAVEIQMCHTVVKATTGSNAGHVYAKHYAKLAERDMERWKGVFPFFFFICSKDIFV